MSADTDTQATGSDTTTISLPASYRDAIKAGKPEHMSMGEYVYQLHEEGEAVLFDADAVAAELGLGEELGAVQDRLASIERTLEGLVG